MARKKVFKGDSSTKRKRLGVDLPEDLKNKFDIVTTQQGKTMTEVIEKLVRRWLEVEREQSKNHL